MSEPISITLSLSTTTAHIGDMIPMRVQVSHPSELVVLTPTWPSVIGTFEVHSSTPQPSHPTGTGSVTLIEGALQNFSTGPQLLSPLPLTLSDGRGHSISVKTASATITYGEIPAGPNDKGDIRGIRGAIGPVAWSPWWWVLLAFLAIGGGVYAWKRRQLKIQGPPPIPADEEALSALKALLGNGWIEAGKLKEFYSALSDIVRTYLEHAFTIQALERTTSELMRDVRRSPKIPTDIQVVMRELLEECDLVKFAKYRPADEEAVKAHALATQIVDKTKGSLKDNDEIR